MICTIAILGCATVALLVIGVASAVMTGVGVIVGAVQKDKAQEAQEDSANKLQLLQELNQEKVEKTADAQAAVQAKMQTRNSERLKAQMASNVALDLLRARRAKSRTENKVLDLNSSGGNQAHMTVSRPNGSPISNKDL